MLKKEGYWQTYYVCSICGEHSSSRYNECPFCHNSMKNPEQTTDDTVVRIHSLPPAASKEFYNYIKTTDIIDKF
jgi:predicted ATP-dependent serine protease